MFDVVVIGQGLSGLLSAISAKEQGFRTALVSIGSGKIIQSTGVMDLIPGSHGGLKEWMEFHQLTVGQKQSAIDAVEQFKELTERLGYPYSGDPEKPVQIVTGAGHVKTTTLYPQTIKLVPERGHVVIVGFQGISDFQPAYVAGNLHKHRPGLTIDTMKISLGKHSQRTMTQLDAARLLDQEEVRNECLTQIKQQLTEKNIRRPSLFIFPASLGIENWRNTVEQLTRELGTAVTEAPGMPPNATAIRLNERLKKQAVRLGIRFYSDTTVTGFKADGQMIQSLMIKTVNQVTELQGKQFVLATGGILGGGLEVTPSGLKETALGLKTDEEGALLNCPVNLHPVGAANGLQNTQYGITGGIFSIVSAYQTINQACQLASVEGGTRSA